MKIAVDLDEVLSNTVSRILEYHNETYKTDFNIEQVKNYNLWFLFGETKEETLRKINDFYKTHYFKQLKPLQEAVEAINSLKKSHELNLVTARQDPIIKETKEWIGKYFSDCFSAIYFAKEWSVKDTNAKRKVDICKQLEVRLIIEDQPSYALECAQQEINTLLLNKPWNQKAVHKNLIRVGSWPEILKIINSLE